MIIMAIRFTSTFRNFSQKLNFTSILNAKNPFVRYSIRYTSFFNKRKYCEKV